MIKSFITLIVAAAVAGCASTPLSFLDPEALQTLIPGPSSRGRRVGVRVKALGDWVFVQLSKFNRGIQYESSRRSTLQILAGIAGIALVDHSAHALPSFARQTGEACTACHVQTWGADLLPRGREFKLRGYTDGEVRSSWIPPVSATIYGGVFTDLDPGQGKIADANSSYKASLYYAGRIVDHLGAYVSLSYANRNGALERYFVDKFDLRLANQVEVGGVKVNYGISANNQPGVQDLWNTVPPWNFLWAYWGASRLLEIDGIRAGNSGGASVFSMIGDWVYLEAGAYASLPRDVQRGIGRSKEDPDPMFYTSDLPQLDGGAPYWRFAIQHTLGDHYFSVGHFGFIAETRQPSFFSVLNGNPLGLVQYRTSTTDVGLDATYQYVGNPDHIFELKGTYVRESQRSRSKAYPLPVEQAWSSTTELIRVNAAYTWEQTVGISFGYHRQSPGLGRRGFFPFAYNSRDLEAYTAELAYTPFGKVSSLGSPWLNLRLSLIYAGDLHGQGYNDTMFVNGSLAF